MKINYILNDLDVQKHKNELRGSDRSKL